MRVGVACDALGTRGREGPARAMGMRKGWDDDGGKEGKNTYGGNIHRKMRMLGTRRPLQGEGRKQGNHPG